MSNGSTDVGYFLRGNPIAIVQDFYGIDPETGDTTLVDPDHATFMIRDPDGGETDYVWPTDAAFSHPSSGRLILNLVAPLPVGDYYYRVESSGDLTAVGEGAFTIIESAVLAPDPGEQPIEGPCAPWIRGSDVYEFAPNLSGIADGSEAFKLNTVAYMASQLLFELSGRKYANGCEETVRPCRAGCAGWLGTATVAGTAAWYWGPWQGVWGWWDDQGNSRCGCGVESRALLSGYPVREILEVKIDGETLDPVDENGFPNYRLDGWRWLTRLGYVDDQDVQQPRWWPACQNTSLEDDQPGTWSVRYRYGVAPPIAGRMAAQQLAVELWKAGNGGDCALPQGVVRLQRQGVTIERGLLLQWGQSITSRGIRTGSWTTGLELVDAFLSVYNPWGMRRRPAFWSPDLPEFAQKLGV